MSEIGGRMINSKSGDGDGDDCSGVRQDSVARDG